MDHRKEYERWMQLADDEDILTELNEMDEVAAEDAFYRDLSFGTGGLRGTIGAGTNRMNVYVVRKASQGLSDYLLKKEEKPAIVIGYDSRIKSDVFAREAASVFAANGIDVWMWPELTPVPTVSFAVRYLHASQGVMITASHNPAEYNGYKVYGRDGCQITTEAAASILNCINELDIFHDVRCMDIREAVSNGAVRHVEAEVLEAYLDEVRAQSVIYGDKTDRSIGIVYTPLNGAGLKAVTAILEKSGFDNVTVVEEQKHPDGSFPTCPYPNPEIAEAMALGLEYCERLEADLLLATDPDADRCGIAVKGDSGYRLMTGNETGLLLLDFICSQRIKHSRMPADPVFVKTIVTTDLAERIAAYYGVDTVNVLTGFKYIGEIIGGLESKGREHDYIFGFEESYGYLAGTYARDKDAVNAVMLIAEMAAYYKAKGLSLEQKLKELYDRFGYCLNTLHSYTFPGSAGMKKMRDIMDGLRKVKDRIGEIAVTHADDYINGIAGLPPSDVIKFYFKGDGISGSVVVRPSGTEPKIKTYISVTAPDINAAHQAEQRIRRDLESML